MAALLGACSEMPPNWKRMRSSAFMVYRDDIHHGSPAGSGMGIEKSFLLYFCTLWEENLCLQGFSRCVTRLAIFDLLCRGDARTR